MLLTVSRRCATGGHSVRKAPAATTVVQSICLASRTPNNKTVHPYYISSFSTTSNHIVPHTPIHTTALKDLVAVLQKEHQSEIDEGGTKMEPEVKKLMDIVVKKNAWQIVDSTTEGPFTKLQRNHKSMKILVSFHCQDLLYEDSDEHNTENQNEDEIAPQPYPYAVETPPGSLRFTATATPIIQSGQQKTLILQGTAECGAAWIDAVSVADDAIHRQKLHTVDAIYDNYAGPAFAKLNKKLKDEFQRFLELDMGIDSDMATFMNAYADYKEQQHYIKFLDECHKALVCLD